MLGIGHQDTAQWFFIGVVVGVLTLIVGCTYWSMYL